MQSVERALVVFACFLAAPAFAADDEEARFLSRVRQLTFEGRRAGEGYFSPDGGKLVFQSERIPENPFFQIYELDFDTGDTRRISTGVGKTTCAFFRPGTGDILFASTHADPASERLQREELEFRRSGQKRRYDWDYDPHMDLWVREGATGALRRLSDAEGYDAEAGYSPDGKWIVFASNRIAYEGDLDPEDLERRELDPAYFAEIYVMRADGKKVRRLTTSPGYDGGPFFTADGKRIVWRRFDVEGLHADVWTMDARGGDERRITDFDSMSWAPFPHPSGEYFIFTSNKHGFSNFELFLVDVDGTREPVRVTYTDGFDGLPVFSPDGEKLAWTSRRRSGSGAQIVLAAWDHEAARRALAEAPERGGGGR